jgi:hypothetical protein
MSRAPYPIGKRRRYGNRTAVKTEHGWRWVPHRRASEGPRRIVSFRVDPHHWPTLSAAAEALGYNSVAQLARAALFDAVARREIGEIRRQGSQP